MVRDQFKQIGSDTILFGYRWFSGVFSKDAISEECNLRILEVHEFLEILFNRFAIEGTKVLIQQDRNGMSPRFRPMTEYAMNDVSTPDGVKAWDGGKSVCDPCG